MLIDKVKKLLDIIKKYNLLGVEKLKKYNPSQIALIYNGIGGFNLTLELRAFLTSTFSDFAAPAVIHDILWHLHDKSDLNFKASNLRFMRNALKIILNKYGKFDPRRYIGKSNAYLMHKLLQHFGSKHYHSKCDCDFCKGKRA